MRRGGGRKAVGQGGTGTVLVTVAKKEPLFRRVEPPTELINPPERGGGGETNRGHPGRNPRISIRKTTGSTKNRSPGRRLIPSGEVGERS